MSLYTTYNDEQLLQLLQSGDEKGFEVIYERYWKRMLAMAFLRLQRIDEAEDVVQDVFASLWQRRGSISIQSLENWLSTAVKYKIINKINRQLHKEISAEHLEEKEYTDSSVEQRFLERTVATEINRLPEKCRTVFQYSRDHGFSNSEIAQKLNISEKTVEKHITSARRQLSLQLRQLLQSILFLGIILNNSSIVW